MLTSKASFLAFLLLIIIVPPEPEEPAPTTVAGDCGGWSVDSSCSESAFVTATGHLEKELNGVFIELGQTSDELMLEEGGSFQLENTWNADLSGGVYRVRVEMTKYYGDFAASPTAEDLANFAGDVEDATLTSDTFTCVGTAFADALTPGFWKNHEEVWSDVLLPLGDPANVYTQAELLVILNKQVKGDIRIILAKHLIAAKLNLLAGANPETFTGVPTETALITDNIAAGDEYLAQFGAYDPSLNGCFPDAKPSGSTKQEGVFIKDGLDNFNNGQ